MTQADLGLADAYINGDFAFVDKDRGLLNLFMVIKSQFPGKMIRDSFIVKNMIESFFIFQILIANRDNDSSDSKLIKKRCVTRFKA